MRFRLLEVDTTLSNDDYWDSWNDDSNSDNNNPEDNTSSSEYDLNAVEKKFNDRGTRKEAMEEFRKYQSQNGKPWYEKINDDNLELILLPGHNFGNNFYCNYVDYLGSNGVDFNDAKINEKLRIIIDLVSKGKIDDEDINTKENHLADADLYKQSIDYFKYIVGDTLANIISRENKQKYFKDVTLAPAEKREIITLYGDNNSLVKTFNLKSDSSDVSSFDIIDKDAFFDGNNIIDEKSARKIVQYWFDNFMARSKSRYDDKEKDKRVSRGSQKIRPGDNDALMKAISDYLDHDFGGNVDIEAAVSLLAQAIKSNNR